MTIGFSASITADSVDVAVLAQKGEELGYDSFFGVPGETEVLRAYEEAGADRIIFRLSASEGGGRWRSWRVPPLSFDPGYSPDRKCGPAPGHRPVEG